MIGINLDDHWTGIDLDEDVDGPYTELESVFICKKCGCTINAKDVHVKRTTLEAVKNNYNALYNPSVSFEPSRCPRCGRIIRNISQYRPLQVEEE